MNKAKMQDCVVSGAFKRLMRYGMAWHLATWICTLSYAARLKSVLWVLLLCNVMQYWIIIFFERIKMAEISLYILKYFSSFAAVKLAKKVRAIICLTTLPSLFCQFNCSERWKILYYCYVRIFFGGTNSVKQ